MNYKDLGRRIRMLRQKQHMTQERLAEEIDMSSSFLGHIERGTRIASLETLVKVCNLYIIFSLMYQPVSETKFQHSLTIQPKYVHLKVHLVAFQDSK